MRGRGSDERAIREVARDYIESWLEGDGDRMRRALHPMLAKRGLDYGPDSSPTSVHHLDTEYMVASAARGPRQQYAKAIEITILDLADSIASVRVAWEPFIDYLHLTKLDSRWAIVNVLYEDRNPGQ